MDGIPNRPADPSDTGRISHQLRNSLVEMRDKIPHTAASETMDPDKFLETLANKVANKVGESGNGKADSQIKTLGLHLGSWTKMLAAWVLAGIVALATWHLTIRDEIGKRPTTPQIEESLKKTFEHHDKSSMAHPPIQKRLEVIEGEQQTIRESQIRQEIADKQQTDVLKEIKDDVKRLRRRAQ